MNSTDFVEIRRVLVRLKGLEPARITAREPKSRMSTNSITGAFIFHYSEPIGVCKEKFCFSHDKRMNEQTVNKLCYSRINIPQKSSMRIFMRVVFYNTVLIGVDFTL